MHWNKKVPTLTIVHKLPIFSVQNTNLACELSKSDALARSRDCFFKHDEAAKHRKMQREQYVPRRYAQHSFFKTDVTWTISKDNDGHFTRS